MFFCVIPTYRVLSHSMISTYVCWYISTYSNAGVCWCLHVCQGTLFQVETTYMLRDTTCPFSPIVKAVSYEG